MLEAKGIYGLRTASLVEALAADARPEVRLSTPRTAAAAAEGARLMVIGREADAFCCDSPTPARTSIGGIRCLTVAVVRAGPSPQQRPSSYRGRPV
jgi:hypothetical protein